MRRNALGHRPSDSSVMLWPAAISTTYGLAQRQDMPRAIPRGRDYLDIEAALNGPTYYSTPRSNRRSRFSG